MLYPWYSVRFPITLSIMYPIACVLNFQQDSILHSHGKHFMAHRVCTTSLNQLVTVGGGRLAQENPCNDAREHMNITVPGERSGPEEVQRAM